MKVKMPAEGPPDDIVREVKTVVSSWTPKRGPDWADLEARVGARPRQLFRTYALAVAALTLILVLAFATITTFNLGSLGSQPVVTQGHHP